MDVWLVGCWACVDNSCIVIYDHEPTECELLEIFCSSVVENREVWLEMKHYNFSEVFNKKIDDLFD